MSSPATRTHAASTAPGDGHAALSVAAVAVTLVLWASAFVAIRHLGRDFSPGALSLGRLLVAALVLGLVAWPRELVRPTRSEWVRIAVIGVLWYAVYGAALNAGERLVDAGTAAMLIQVSPLLIALLAALFLGERFTLMLGIGLALAFAGVAVIALSPADTEPVGGAAGGTDGAVAGIALCLVSAMAYSVSVIVQKPLMARLPAVQVTWLACSVGALVSLPFLPQLVRETQEAPLASVGWVAYLGVLPTAVAFTTYAYALRHSDAGRLGVTTYLVPPITIVIGWLLLRETPPTPAYAGGALALLGVAVARRTQRAGRRVDPRDP